MASLTFGASSRYGGMGTARLFSNDPLRFRSRVVGLEICAARAWIDDMREQ